MNTCLICKSEELPFATDNEGCQECKCVIHSSCMTQWLNSRYGRGCCPHCRTQIVESYSENDRDIDYEDNQYENSTSYFNENSTIYFHDIYNLNLFIIKIIFGNFNSNNYIQYSRSLKKIPETYCHNEKKNTPHREGSIKFVTRRDGQKVLVSYCEYCNKRKRKLFGNHFQIP